MELLEDVDQWSMSIIQQKLWSAKIWLSPTAKRNCFWIDWILVLQTRIREAKHHLCPTFWLAWFMPAKRRKNTLEMKTLAIPSTPTNFVTCWNKQLSNISMISIKNSNTIYSLYYTSSPMNSFFFVSKILFPAQQKTHPTTSPIPIPTGRILLPLFRGFRFSGLRRLKPQRMCRRKC